MEAHMFHVARQVGKFGDVLAKKNVMLSWLVNSNMVKPERFDLLHLVYHFTVPLRNHTTFGIIYLIRTQNTPKN